MAQRIAATLLIFGLLITSNYPHAQAAAVTGDPWKMLVIVYRQTDVDYVDVDNVQKHLTATMPALDEARMVQSFLKLPHRGGVFNYSDQAAELEANIVYASRPLTSVSEVGGAYSYWPSPDDTMPEIEQYAPLGMYDSIIVFWQASDPNTGQSIPSGGWGWGGRVGPYGMTYASVFNLSFYWETDNCNGEVFLHEWLHGVTGFYWYLGFDFPVEDLHGGEEAGYTTNANGCWTTWLQDYMRGLVYENGQRTALVPEAWQSGSITTHTIEGWRAEYYNNETVSDLPVVVRDDPQIDFDWEGNSPHPLLNEDHFSARWTRNFTFSDSTYRFTIFHDDGARLYLDDQLIYENWCDNCRLTSPISLPVSGGLHQVRLEVRENQGWAGASLSWVVEDAIPPGGNIVFPNSSVTIQPGPVDFTAEAWDNAGGAGVEQVEFFVSYDGSWKRVGVDTTAPYGLTWTAPDNLADQTMYFAIDVTDKAGNENTDAGGIYAVQYKVCRICGLAESGWPLLRGNLLKNGRSPFLGPQNPRVDWTISGNGTGSPPVLGPDRQVYLGMNKKLMAVTPDGGVAWSYEAPMRFIASPAVTKNEMLYAANEDGKLYAFHTNGNLEWTYQTDGWISSAPVVGSDGVIYFGSSDGQLRALTPGGKLKWTFSANSQIESSPAIGADGAIFFGSSGRTVYGLNQDGTERWRYHVGESIYGSPAIGPDGTIYIVSNDARMYALDSNNGVRKWTFTMPGYSWDNSAAVARDGTIYVTNGLEEPALYAVRTDGSQKWKYSLPTGAVSSPTIDADGIVYVVTDDSVLYAFYPTGKLKWIIFLDTKYWLQFRHNPVIDSQGNIYISAYSPAKLYAVKETFSQNIPMVIRK